MNKLCISFALLFASLFTMSFVYVNNPTTDPGAVKESANLVYAIYPVINTNKVRLNYEKLGSEKVVVKIYNNQNKLIFVDVIKEESSKRNYDLTNIESEDYRFEISCGEYKSEQIVSTQPKTESFYAYLSPEPLNNRVRIAFQHATSPIIVAVRDIKGNVLYSKTMNTTNFASLLNLSELKTGEYTISVSGDNDSYEQTYSID